MRGFNQFAASLWHHETSLERHQALDFAELCTTRGPQVAYEPSEKWHHAQRALAAGWVYVETREIEGGKTDFYVSNLREPDIKRIRETIAIYSPRP